MFAILLPAATYTFIFFLKGKFKTLTLRACDNLQDWHVPNVPFFLVLEVEVRTT